MKKILTGSPFSLSDADSTSVGCGPAADECCAILKEPGNNISNENTL